MALAPGTRLGSYEVTAPIGEGGMGAVYRARDARLNRDVALKVLLPAVANDPERLARFRREAQTLAALNHPHIGAIYGLEESNGTIALVLELVEGPTLADRIAGGPLPLDEALPIAKQIAEALEAAHEQGIIHRDLKPANIKVRDDGTVKVLDFGLAKALDPAAASSVDALNSPTITSPAMTMQGVILGTAAYMAPEQARGRPVDRRADIWAFGCVLYEMLTGQRVFAGDDVTDTLTAVLRDAPDWTALPAATPPPIRTMLRRCLERDARQRAPHVSIARLAIEDAATTAGAPEAVERRGPSSRWTWPAAAALLAIVAAIGGYGLQARRPAAAALPTESTLLVPQNLYTRAPSSRFALSPDGRRLAYAGIAPGNGTAGVHLYVRPLAGGDAQLLAGTEDARAPFWSPDSRTIAFFANGDLKRIAASGGSVTTIARAVAAPTIQPGSWSRDDMIVLSLNDAIVKVSARGGEPQPVTTPGPDMAHDSPVFLPDGRLVLYGAYKGIVPVGVFATSIDGGPATQLLSDTAHAVYASGFLLFTRRDALLAQAFDSETLQLSGDAMTVTEDVQANVSVRVASAFSASSTGSIVFQTGTGADQRDERLFWLSRSGSQTPVVLPPGRYMNLELSPDGERALATIPEEGARADVWILNLGQGQRTRLTFDAAADRGLWSRDGRSVLISKGGNWLVKSADGSGEERPVPADSATGSAHSWAPDGRTVLFERIDREANARALWMRTIDGRREPAPLIASAASVRWPKFSPDGRWIAYTSDESGEREVYVTRADGSGRWQVSTEGGTYPRWSTDGRELYFFVQGWSKLASARISPSGSALEIGQVVPLVDIGRALGIPGYFYDVAPDGRFLVAMAAETNRAVGLTLLQNWPERLRSTP